MIVKLFRLETGPQGTFGRISVGDKSWYTVERQWLNNLSDVSCFPAGIYQARMTFSNRFKTELYEMFGIPGRFACRIHPANLAMQLNGCVALGEKTGTMDGVKCVLVSRPAVRAFESALDKKPFSLEVINVFDSVK